MKKTHLLFVITLIILNTFTIHATKDWTVMVFMNGDNDLESYGIYNINDMEKVGSDDNVNFVVQFDRSVEHGVGDNNWTGARRYLIKSEPGSSTYGDIVSENLMELGETDMGNWQTAVDFFRWSVENYPAEKYCFIFWNHGSGWLKSNEDVDPLRGISYDDGSGNHIDSPGLKKAVTEMAKINGKKIDIIGFDACLMSMVEIGVQMRDSVKYMVGSEASEPAGGWDYEKAFTYVKENSKDDSKDMALGLAGAYAEKYEGSTDWMYLKKVTFSAVDLSLMDRVILFAKDLVNTVKRSDSNKAAQDAISVSQHYEVDYFSDLCDFTRKLMDKSGRADIRESGDRLIRAVEQSIIFNWWQNDALAGSNGLSVYTPSAENYKEHYEETDFSRLTKWQTMFVPLK